MMRILSVYALEVSREDFVIMTGDSDSYADTQDEAVVTLHSTPKHTMRDGELSRSLRSGK